MSIRRKDQLDALPDTLGAWLQSQFPAPGPVQPAMAETGQSSLLPSINLQAIKDVFLNDLRTFQAGALDPLFNFGADQQAMEPAVYVDHQGKVFYGPVNAPLGANPPQPTDATQGSLGDCYFLAALAAVAQTHPELLQKMIVKNPDGTYTVRFQEANGFDWMRHLGRYGVWDQAKIERLFDAVGLHGSHDVPVTIDGEIPQYKGSGILADPYAHDKDNALWVPLMETAFAKYWGNFTAIGDGGDAGAALEVLTGGRLARFHPDVNNPDATFERIKAACNARYPMVAGTNGSAGGVKGLVGEHGYTILGVTEQNGQKCVVLRNPWGQIEPGNDGSDDGIFALPIEQFVQGFDTVDEAQI